MELFLNDFLRGDYMPHGHCYFWQPGILWVNVLSDLFIALAYFTIPVALIIFINKRKDVEFRGIFLLFSSFILFCGLTHLFSIWVIWHGDYGLHGLMKLATAIVSVTTAVVLFKMLPQALKIPSPQALEDARARAMHEKLLRETADIFRITTDMVSTGLLVVDSDFKIQMANPTVERIFQYSKTELIGMPVSQLVGQSEPQHDVFMKKFFANPEGQQYSMAGGRTVKGTTANGNTVDLEVGITFHEVDQDKKAFVHLTEISEREKVRQINRQIERGSKRSIEAVKDGVWEWYIESNEGWWNQRLAEMIGLPDDTPYSFEAWYQHVHPDDRQAVDTAIDVALNQQQPYMVEYRGRARSGEYEWFRSRGSVTFNQDKPIHMAGLLSNIHGEKQIQKELAEKSRFLDAIVSKSLAGMYILDLASHQITYINAAYTSITGYTLDDLEQILELTQLYHADDLNNIIQQRKTLGKAQVESDEFEFRFKHKQGHWIWCYASEVVYKTNEQDEPISIIGSFIELTELKAKESQLKQLATDFSSIFELAAVGIAQVGLDGRWIMVNKKLCQILGRNKEDLLKTDFQHLTYPEDLELDLQHVQALIEGKADNYAMEKRYIHSNGQIIWALLTVSIVRDEQGRPLHFISVVEDICQRKQIELKLEESNQALEKFAYTASHDLQEPLRKVTAFSGLLSERLTGKLADPEALYELERISSSANRMSKMITDLLELSRFSSGPIHKQMVQFTDLFNDLMNELDDLLVESNTDLRLESDGMVYVDFDLFVLVLKNIVQNAIKYAKPSERPNIRIRLVQRPDSTEIVIQDEGIGFDSKFAKEIFLPFKRLCDRSIEGTGMGLAICRQIINKHKGSLMAHSQEGKGSEFKIVLPAGDVA